MGVVAELTSKQAGNWAATPGINYPIHDGFGRWLWNNAICLITYSINRIYDITGAPCTLCSNWGPLVRGECLPMIKSPCGESRMLEYDEWMGEPGRRHDRSVAEGTEILLSIIIADTLPCYIVSRHQKWSCGGTSDRFYGTFNLIFGRPSLTIILFYVQETIVSYNMYIIIWFYSLYSSNNNYYLHKIYNSSHQVSERDGNERGK